MKVALLVTCYNRPEYLERCLQTLSKVEPIRGFLVQIHLLDDGSTDKDVWPLIQSFEHDSFKVERCGFDKNVGVAQMLHDYYEIYFNKQNFDLVVNLDADAIVKPEFLKVVLSLKKKNPYNIVTGFHSINRNRDGSERHKVVSKHKGYWLKESVGGINFVINKREYELYVKPALALQIKGKANWDHKASQLSWADGNAIVCAVPSVVDHIGFDSSMNHREEPDVAADFTRPDLKLKNVTLIGADGNHVDWLIRACEQSCKLVEFGNVVMITRSNELLRSDYQFDERFRFVDGLDSAKAYNEFCMKQFNDYVKTDFALVFQGDGYVVNPEAWSPDFLEYDYVGATWWFKDGMNVGNGGFSLRSKKLLEILATDKNLKETFPEDQHICRTYRKYLEKKHGVKFAPAEVADRFSIEGCYSPDKRYNGAFGFHGWEIDWRGADLTHIPQKPQTLLLNAKIKSGGRFKPSRGWEKSQPVVNRLP